MKARYTCTLSSLFFCLLLLGIFGERDVNAQSNCTSPNLGEGGPEVCVTIFQTGGGPVTPMTLRAPADVGDPPLAIVGPYGQYELNLTVAYTFGGLGMAIEINGTVERIVPGTQGILIDAEGGWGTALPGGGGSVSLSGFATGTAGVESGGAVGFPFGTVPAEDVTYTGFLVTCAETVLGPRPPGNVGEFDCSKTELPVADGGVAIKNITVVHINDVGEMVDLPAGTGVGEPPSPVPGSEINGTVETMVNLEGTWEIWFNGRFNGTTLLFLDAELHFIIPLLWFGYGPGFLFLACYAGPPAWGCFYGPNVVNGDTYEIHWQGQFPPGVNILEGHIQVNKNPGGEDSRIPIRLVRVGTPGSISGVKYEDLNGNGKRDEIEPGVFEPGIPDWDIFLDGGQTAAAKTDSEGRYIITNVPQGEHLVSEEDRSPLWRNSTLPDSTVAVTDGTETKKVDFGNYRPGEIHGVKYRDENGNGQIDSPDTREPGWPIFCSGDPDPCDQPEMSTDSSGEFWFMDLPPGTYTISEGTQTDWVTISPSSGTYEILIRSGDIIENIDFFNQPPPPPPPDPSSIHAQKWLDVDGDGIIDPNEPGLNGVTINLNGPTGMLSQVTHDMDLDSSGDIDPITERGWVWFTGLAPGNYTLSETVPVNMTQTAPPGNSFVINLGQGEVSTGHKFGNHPPGADLGDAPDAEDPTRPEFPTGYPTLLINNGAIHLIDESVRIGDLIDPELDGQPTIPADGDDESASDDEDGVKFLTDFISLFLKLDPGSDEETYVPGLVRGESGEIVVYPSTTGILDAWADWNRDGDWDDPGERMYDGVTITPSSDTLTWAAPADASPGYTYSRFRFTLDGSGSYDGFEDIGEVEDYLMYTLRPTDLTSTDDTEDANPGDGLCADLTGNCTLRAAIMETNASGVPWVITASTLGKSGQATLQPLSPLPPITGSLILDGGATLEIDGSLAGPSANGLVLQSSGNWIVSTYLHSFAGDGIRIEGSNNVIFNGRLSNNGGNGINVVSGTGNTFRTNAVSNNGGLGIDLGNDGVTTNDPDDADTGANDLLNTPSLTSVTAENGHIEGSVASTANTDIIVDFFTSPTCDPSGYGEGATYVGSIPLTTDNVGAVSFDLFVSVNPIAVGDAVTATATDSAGNTSEYSSCFFAVTTDIERNPEAELPSEYKLFQNYPNPFNPVTNIRFTISNREWVKLEVYNILGKRVATLVDGWVEPGEFTVDFDASELPSGIYIYRMTAGSFSMSKQLTLLK